MSLQHYRLWTPCYELKPNARHFFDKIFIKAWFCWEEICLFCHMTSIDRLETMIHHIHITVDFRLDILFPHICSSWFLHQNRVGIGGFTLTKHRSVGDEEKSIPFCLNTSNPMIAPPVLPQSAFCALKKTDWPKLDCFKFLVLDILNARRVSAELQLENQSEPIGSSGI